MHQKSCSFHETLNTRAAGTGKGGCDGGCAAAAGSALVGAFMGVGKYLRNPRVHASKMRSRKQVTPTISGHLAVSPGNTQSHPRFSSANHTFREWREHSECLERSWGFPAYLGEAYWNDFVICSVIVSSDPAEPDISGRLQRSRCRVGRGVVVSDIDLPVSGLRIRHHPSRHRHFSMSQEGDRSASPGTCTVSLALRLLFSGT